MIEERLDPLQMTDREYDAYYYGRHDWDNDLVDVVDDGHRF